MVVELEKKQNRYLGGGMKRVSDGLDVARKEESSVNDDFDLHTRIRGGLCGRDHYLER